MATAQRAARKAVTAPPPKSKELERTETNCRAHEMLTRIGDKVREPVEKANASDDKNVRFWASKILKALNDKTVLA